MRHFITGIVALICSGASLALPEGFVYLKDINPTIIQDMRYAGANNFIGRPIHGYEAPECILTKKAALALSQAQRKLQRQSLSLKVYDCYRPQMAVDDFVAWSQDPSDQKMKQAYYPKVNKANLFKLGYIAAHSSHTRGSTVDITIVRVDKQKIIELPMGTHFDFMDPSSYPLSMAIHGKEKYNRLVLRNAMQQAGFRPYGKEWWHFTLNHEPFPSTYFNFPVE